MPEPTIIYLRLVVNKADLIHLPARRKERLIKTQMKGLVSGGYFNTDGKGKQSHQTAVK